MTSSEYIDPSEATRIRVYQEGADRWAIHAVNDLGGYTEACWNRDGHPEKRLTRERAVEMVPEFVAAVELPAGLPVEIVPMRPTETQAVALLRRIVAAQEQFFDRNENGSHDEFQRAADEMHDAIDAAAAYLGVAAK